MTNENHRTIRTVKVVIETTGLSLAEHEKRVSWADANVQSANRYVKDAFVSTVVYDKDGTVVGFTGTGGSGVSPETIEIIEDLVGEPTGTAAEQSTP